MGHDRRLLRPRLHPRPGHGRPGSRPATRWPPPATPPPRCRWPTWWPPGSSCPSRRSRAAAPHRPRFAALSGELRHPGIRRLLLASLHRHPGLRALEATFSLLAKDVFELDQDPRRLRLRLHRRGGGGGAGRADRPADAPLRRDRGCWWSGWRCRRSPSWRSPSPGTARRHAGGAGPHVAGLRPDPALALVAPLALARKEDQGGTLGIGESRLGARPDHRPGGRHLHLQPCLLRLPLRGGRRAHGAWPRWWPPRCGPVRTSRTGRSPAEER